VTSLEKKRIVLEKAIKLREHRKESKAKQELVQKKREEALLRYKYVLSFFAYVALTLSVAAPQDSFGINTLVVGRKAS
jgi:hypothetical protein